MRQLSRWVQKMGNSFYDKTEMNSAIVIRDGHASVQRKNTLHNVTVRETDRQHQASEDEDGIGGDDEKPSLDAAHINIIIISSSSSKIMTISINSNVIHNTGQTIIAAWRNEQQFLNVLLQDVTSVTCAGTVYI